MRGRLAPTALLITVSLATFAASCRGAGGGGLAFSFDVRQLPPEPPAPPPPEPLPPAPEIVSNPAPAGPTPAEAAAERLRGLISRLQTVHFETGRWDLDENARQIVESNAEVLREVGEMRATIEGHADERGSDTYNQALGIWRAKSVKDLLRSLGVAPSRMVLLSHGKNRPASPGKDRESLSLNRRVEIILRPGT